MCCETCSAQFFLECAFGRLCWWDMLTFIPIFVAFRKKHRGFFRVTNFQFCKLGIIQLNHSQLSGSGWWRMPASRPNPIRRSLAPPMWCLGPDLGVGWVQTSGLVSQGRSASTSSRDSGLRCEIGWAKVRFLPISRSEGYMLSSC